MTPEEWAVRQRSEKRYAHAYNRRFGPPRTQAAREERDRMAFLASFLVVEQVRALERWAGNPEPDPAVKCEKPFRPPYAMDYTPCLGPMDHKGLCREQIANYPKGVIVQGDKP